MDALHRVGDEVFIFVEVKGGVGKHPAGTVMRVTLTSEEPKQVRVQQMALQPTGVEFKPTPEEVNHLERNWDLTGGLNINNAIIIRAGKS